MTTDNNLVLGDDHPIFSQEVTDEITSDETISESTTDQEDESQYLVTLDRRNFEANLRELLTKEPELRNIYNRDVGNNAARRYQPRIKELEDHVATYQQLFHREQFSKLTPEEVNEKFQSDPEFARAYTAATHFNGQEPDTKVDGQAIANQVAFSTRSILSSAMRQGLTESDIKELGEAIIAGKYDNDETGQPLQATQWHEMLDNLQADVTDRIVNKRVGSNNPTVEITSPNTQHADTARPDMSASGSRGVRQTQITMRNFLALPIEEQFKMFPNEGDIEKAVADGRIIVEGLER